jgi:hypothetical protein
MWTDEIVRMVAKRAQLEELPQFSGKSPHLAPRQTSPSLIRAAGLPEIDTTDKALHKLCTTPPSWLLLMSALGLVEAICGAIIISGSFLLG